MATKTDPDPGSRVPLTKGRVLRAAIELADESGIESLSMRKLGLALGVEAMSLYNHVANKDEILDGIVDLVAGEVEVPDNVQDWKSAVRQSAISTHEVLLRHPWACNLSVSRPRVGAATLRYVDWLIGCLRDAGFSMQVAHNAMHAIESHIYGFTLQELSFPADLEEMGPEIAALLRQQTVADYPHISEMVRDSTHDDQVEFEFVLDLILDGLERVRDTA
jgi:AcrR family transcriptional regulator